MITLIYALALTPAWADDTAAPTAPAAPAASDAPAAPAPAPAPAAAAPAPSTASNAGLAMVDPPTDPRFGLEVALGSQGSPFSSFDPNNIRATLGVTGRYQLNRAFAIDLGVTHSYDGGTRAFYDESGTSDEDCYDCYEGLYASTTLLAERLDLGLRAELPIWKAFRPFARVAGVGELDVARLDEDTEDPDNLTQLTRVGFTGGGYFAGGFSTPIRVKHQVHIVPSLELGYTALAPVTLGDLGSLARSGVTFRFSSGVSF